MRPTWVGWLRWQVRQSLSVAAGLSLAGWTISAAVMDSACLLPGPWQDSQALVSKPRFLSGLDDLVRVLLEGVEDVFVASLAGGGADVFGWFVIGVEFRRGRPVFPGRAPAVEKVRVTAAASTASSDDGGDWRWLVLSRNKRIISFYLICLRASFERRNPLPAPWQTSQLSPNSASVCACGVSQSRSGSGGTRCKRTWSPGAGFNLPCVSATLFLPIGKTVFGVVDVAHVAFGRVANSARGRHRRDSGLR